MLDALATLRSMGLVFRHLSTANILVVEEVMLAFTQRFHPRPILTISFTTGPCNAGDPLSTVMY